MAFVVLEVNMEREYKFRGWDAENQKMYYFNGIFNDRPYKETSTWVQYESHKKYYNLAIMECSGLDDINDIDIYEGDIIPWDNYYFGDSLIKPGIGIVKYDNGSFYIKSIDGNIFSPELCKEEIYNNQLKVAGNIYETPELLQIA